MKTYRYKGFAFRSTSSTHANTGRTLYEVDDMKPAETRPFLTSIRDACEFIRDAVNLGYWIDGAGRTHNTPQH